MASSRNAGFKSKIKVKGSQKLADSGTGALRTVLEARKGALAMLSAKKRKEVMDEVLERAGAFFLNEFLPKRFTPYAAKKLRYRSKDKQGDFESGRPSRLQANLKDSYPLVDTGELAARALSNSSVKAIGASGKNPRITMKFNQAHFLRAKDKAVLLRVPASEVKAMAEVFDQFLTEALNG